MKDFYHKEGSIITTKHNDKLTIIKCIRKKFTKNGSNRKGYVYKCNTCGHIGEITEENLKHGCGCEICHGNRKVDVGINDL